MFSNNILATVKKKTSEETHARHFIYNKGYSFFVTELNKISLLQGKVHITSVKISIYVL